MNANSAKKKIRIECKGSGSESLDNLIPFQGDLKELTKANYEKLKTEILQHGFSAPFFYWASNEKIPKKYLLDGHQRKITLVAMEQEGFYLPNKFPVVEIKAKTKREAKSKLLAFTSQYGKISKAGLIQFAEHSKIDIEKVVGRFSFDAISFDGFSQGVVSSHERTNGIENVDDGDGEENETKESFILIVDLPSEELREELFDELESKQYLVTKRN